MSNGIFTSGSYYKTKRIARHSKYRLIYCTVLPAFLRFILETANLFRDLTVPVFLLPYF